MITPVQPDFSLLDVAFPHEVRCHNCKVMLNIEHQSDLQVIIKNDRVLLGMYCPVCGKLGVYHRDETYVNFTPEAFEATLKWHYLHEKEKGLFKNMTRGETFLVGYGILVFLWVALSVFVVLQA